MKSVCKNCQKEFTVKKNAGGIYCSIQCQADCSKQSVIDNWKKDNSTAVQNNGQLRRAIKNWVKERDNYTCTLCGWSEVNPASGKIPVEVDHIDGDYDNNSPDNLRTICPNCHSLTPTWKNTNGTKRAKKGRAYRRIDFKSNSDVSNDIRPSI